jgi:hypothetical protein
MNSGKLSEALANFLLLPSILRPSSFDVGFCARLPSRHR